MRAFCFLLCTLTGLVGCAEHGLRVLSSDGFTECPVNDGSVSHDMGADMAKTTCAAAKGLSGVPLICTDFSSVQTLTDLKNMGWDFTSKCPVGWTVANSNLQVNSFSTFADSCIFTTRPLMSNEYQPYSSFTLSVVQHVDISETASQKAQVMLGTDDPLTRLLTQWTGKQMRQQSTIATSKSDLPGGTVTYQPLFKFSATTTAGGSYQGWQIESIAVMGNP